MKGRDIEDRKPWKEAVAAAHLRQHRPPGSTVRTIVSLPPFMPYKPPAPLEDWQVEFWQKLFERMTWDQQREFLQSEGDLESKKAFLMRHGGIIE